MQSRPRPWTTASLWAIAAAAAPSLLAYNVSPSPTFLNQALAFALWGGFVVLLAEQAGAMNWFAGAGPAVAAVGLLTSAALWSWLHGALPASLALSAIGTLAGAALLVLSGAAVRTGRDAVAAFEGFSLAWLMAGLANVAVSLIQVFAPDLPDGDWIAHSNIVGRAVGNLRQPNHLSSLLLWSAIATVTLIDLRRVARAAGVACFAAMIFCVVLSASRTGLVSVGVLALWGLVDRRLAKFTRLVLLSSPLIYAFGWLGMSWWADFSHHTFGGAARLAESDVSGSRFGIWSNTLALIRQQPLAGVGFGEFNFAWSLTPFPGRPTAFFDHTHNLPLQLAVEVGVPMAALVLLLLLVGVWRMGRSAVATEGALGLCQRAALMFVLMIGLHSMLEYPLWYAYFLLPAAWAFGFGLGRTPEGTARTGGRTGASLLAPAGATMMLLAALSVWDYLRVAEIFSASDDAPPLDQRIAQGQHSVLFSHHADYAAATTDVDPALRAHAFDGASHYLLDTRLMVAWAEHLAAQGRLDAARHVAQRLREFHNPLSKDFLDVCEGLSAKAAPAASAPVPFQCVDPQRVPGWREFLAR